MWYFAWILGIAAAVMLSVLNAMWFEAQDRSVRRRTPSSRRPRCGLI